MRSLMIAVAVLSLSGCATTGPGADQTPVETVRVEGQGYVILQAGSDRLEAPFSLIIYQDRAGELLGPPTAAGWSLHLQDYCRDRDSWVQSVLIGPAGEVWRGDRVAVPAGPDRIVNWSIGGLGSQTFGAPPTPGLVEALAEGGRFTLVLEDDTGQRWRPIIIDTLTQAEREGLYAAFVASRQDPAPNPYEGVPMVLVTEPVLEPMPERSCPEAAP